MKYDTKNPRPTPSQERLKELFNYNEDTGILSWKFHPNRKDLIGRQCGAIRKGGYLAASVDGFKYSVHRLVYKYMTGNEAVIIDHLNGKPGDNRWCNLKSVTPKENNLNTKLPKDNKSGSIGVFFHEGQNRFLATVRIDRKSIHLGSFETEKEAKAARKAANKLLGFSDRHGEAA